MRLEVLLSCMYQDNADIIGRTNMFSDILVINQTNIDHVSVTNKDLFKIRIISTTERGLSKSRNMAMRQAKGDICLICDDDEIMYDGYETTILRFFEEQLDADVIAFQIDNAGKVYPKKKKQLNYLTALKIASWQIAFRRKSIIDNQIWFDESLGSGVSKAGGEENMFLYDCLKKGLHIYFVPLSIGRMIKSESQWFHGYTKDYFYDRGIFTKKLMGRLGATLYGLYYLIFKYSLYKNDITFRESFNSLFKGIYD